MFICRYYLKGVVVKKKIVALFSVCVLFAGLNACSDENGSKGSKVVLETFTSKVSYVLGSDIGKSLKDTETEINLDSLYLGIEDSLNSQELKISPEEMESLKMEFAQKLQEAYQVKIKETGAKNMAEGETFLAANKDQDGVIVTASGLQYKVISEGDGVMPAATDKVKVHYRGTLINGKEFDSSLTRQQPAEFQIDTVIPGWVEALQLMKVGSKYQLFIPPALAYGEREAGPDIGPNTTLIFEVELLEILK